MLAYISHQLVNFVRVDIAQHAFAVEERRQIGIQLMFLNDPLELRHLR